MTKQIGTYEARTHWSEIMQEVKNGAHYVITHHGDPVAELVPAQSQSRQARSRVAARQLLDFMARRQPAEPGLDLKAAIEEGRD